MKCPTANCPNILPTHARRKYCAACRNSMARHAKKRPAEILEASRKYQKSLFRLEHVSERKQDINEALTQKRKARREKKTAVFGSGKRSATAENRL